MTEIIHGTLRMTGDRILLKPLDWSGSDVHGAGSKIQVMRSGRPLRGIVRAVGPGIHPVSKRKDLGDGRRKVDYSRRFRPTEVRVGDTIELGGLNIFDGKGYEFPEVFVNGETCIIVTERDVAAIHERAA